MDHFLIVNNLQCGYPGGFRLDNISFSLRRGVFAGIIGPNGSGKTTLFRGISRELPAHKGVVMLDNCDLRNLPLREKARNVAVVSQFTDAPDISVEDYVLMGRIPYRQPFQFFDSPDDYAIARHYMELTDVYRLRNKLMSQLSGGEQQLAAIARALAQQPKLLLLDEPTSHLDISHAVQVLNLIQSLSSHLELTVLMIIHDLNLAGEYCDYLLMMNQGHLHRQGTPAEVLTYDAIEEVYNTVVITLTNPLSKKPAVFPVSEKVMKNNLPTV